MNISTSHSDDASSPIVVPPQWPKLLPCKIAFVAEAPSWEELEGLQPLIGPSGRIFNSVLRTAGIDRSMCFVTNVFNQKIPNNNVKNWCSPKREASAGGFDRIPPIGTSGFLRPEYHHHLDRLGKELKQCGANVIVPLGGTALWALSGISGITAHRGNVMVSTSLVPGMKLLPTFHPAAIMHQWKQYTVVVGDLMKAKEEAERGPGIILPKRELLLEPSIADLRSYYERILQSDLLAVDIETGWGQITCIGFAPDTEHALCVPFFDRRNLDKSYWRTVADEADAWRYVRDVCASPVRKVGQNFWTYDHYWLLHLKHIRVNNMVEDTRLQHHALYPELPKSLSFMGNSYSTQGAWKPWGKKQKEKRDD